jgi:hypothetical protein
MPKLLCAFALVVFTTQLATSQTAVTPEEYLIYSVVFRDLKIHSGSEPEPQYFVIISRTKKQGRPIIARSVRFRGMISDFVRKNALSAELKAKFPSFHIYSLVEESEVKALLEMSRTESEEKNKKVRSGSEGAKYIGYDCDSLWKAFYQKYPKADGSYRISRIGFSANRRAAIVEIEVESGCCSGNWTYILTKNRQIWKPYTMAGGFGCA